MFMYQNLGFGCSFILEYVNHYLVMHHSLTFLTRVFFPTVKLSTGLTFEGLLCSWAELGPAA